MTYSTVDELCCAYLCVDAVSYPRESGHVHGWEVYEIIDKNLSVLFLDVR